MKRRRTSSGGSVTGGTGDVKPQILTAGGTQGTVNTYQVVQINLPVPRFGVSMAKSTIFEILRVEFFINGEDTADLVNSRFIILSTTNLGRATGNASTAASFQVDLLNPNTICAASLLQVVTTSGAILQSNPLSAQLNDNNGNGVLVGTDKIFLIFSSVGGTNATTFASKILYRQVNVGIQEYVGIVQSQIQQ